MPGVLTIDRPWRAARPERGCTSATYPSGSAIADAGRHQGPLARRERDVDGHLQVGAGVARVRVRRQRQVRVEADDGDVQVRGRVVVGHEEGIYRLCAVDYAERLTVPLRWWVQGTMFVASLWLAVLAATPEAVAWSVTAVAMAVLVALFVGYGRPGCRWTADLPGRSGAHPAGPRRSR